MGLIYNVTNVSIPKNRKDIEERILEGYSTLERLRQLVNGHPVEINLTDQAEIEKNTIYVVKDGFLIKMVHYGSLTLERDIAQNHIKGETLKKALHIQEKIVEGVLCLSGNVEYFKENTLRNKKPIAVAVDGDTIRASSYDNSRASRKMLEGIAGLVGYGPSFVNFKGGHYEARLKLN